MKRLSITKKKQKLFIIVSLLGACALSMYFWFLSQQVKLAFEADNEFIPTRIYSAVTRVAPPMARGQLIQKLKALGYTVPDEQQNFSITLHSVNYPAYLIPENHITRRLSDHSISLRFDGTRESSILLSIQSQGRPVNEFFLEPEFVATLGSDQSQIREVMKLEEFPAAIPDAVVAAEDNHFYSHFGVDPSGFARAMWNNLKSFSLSQGGSTITQQLIKNLVERRTRNIFMKINELFLAPILEFQYTKEEILERYLNEVFLGQIGPYEVRGFAEGAKYFYGKSVDQLNLGEIALLVGLIKGPGYYSPYRHFDRAVARQTYVLERMFETQKISANDLSRAKEHPIRLALAPRASNRAPYFVDFVKAQLYQMLSNDFSQKEIEELGFAIYTTLDLQLDQTAQTVIETEIQALEKRYDVEGLVKLQGAFALADQSTGEIKSLIGGRNYAESNFNRILNMKRQAGSTFKPIVYAAAFQRFRDPEGNSFTPSYPILDEPWSWKYDASQPEWSPSNYTNEHRGWIPLRTALINSINIPAAKIAKKVGVETIIETARLLGITSPIPAVPSISLGSVEVSPMELMEVYMTLSNHGVSGTPYVIKGIQNPDDSEFFRFDYRPRQRISPGIADMMTDLLQGVFTEGTATSARAYGFTRPAAGKTGTTNDYRDSWFVGYTPQLTALAWVGLDQGVIREAATSVEDKKRKRALARLKLTGASGALPIWSKIMAQALAYEPPLPFAESDYLTEMRLDIHSGQKATNSCRESEVVYEKVITDREPSNSTCLGEYTKDID